MPDFHFAALVRPSYDADLRPYWIEHYKNMGLDSYTIYIHDVAGEERFTREAIVDYIGAGFSVFRASGPFRIGGLRASCISALQAALPDTDYLVTADSDEFQQIRDYRRTMEGAEVLYGMMVDRFSPELHDAAPYACGISLPEQFPVEGRFSDYLDRDGGDSAFSKLTYKKVLCSRARLKVSFAGSHHLMNQDPGLPCKFGGKILHYPYRESFLRRIAGRAYFRSADISKAARFFGENIEAAPDDYSKDPFGFSEETSRRIELCPNR